MDAGHEVGHTSKAAHQTDRGATKDGLVNNSDQCVRVFLRPMRDGKRDVNMQAECGQL